VESAHTVMKVLKLRPRKTTVV